MVKERVAEVNMNLFAVELRLFCDLFDVFDHYLLMLFQELENVVVVIIESVAVDAGFGTEIRDRDGRELLLPAIKDCILEVNVEQGFMRVHVLDGLLD